MLDWLKDCDCVAESADSVTFVKASAIADDDELKTDTAKRALSLFSSTIDQNLSSKKKAKERLFQQIYHSREIPDHLVVRPISLAQISGNTISPQSKYIKPIVVL